MCSDDLEHKDEGQWAVYEKTAVALDVTSVALIEMDEMCIERES